MYSTIQNSTAVKMISCSKCGNDMPELRFTQYGYDFCVNCSTVGAKRGLPVQFGTGDHTWTDVVIMEEDDYLKYTEQEDILNSNKHNPTTPEVQNYDEDERNLQGPFRIINNSSIEE